MRRFFVMLAGMLSVGCGASGDFAGTWPAGGPGFCTLAGCAEGATLHGSYPIEGRDVGTLVLRTCVNTTCSETLVNPVPPARGDCASALRPWCTIYAHARDSTLEVSIQLPPPLGADSEYQFRDDDRYELSISLPGQAPWIWLRGQAPYSLWYPNGKGCEPECHSVHLSPVQSSGL